MDRAKIFLSYSHHDGQEACDLFSRLLTKAECGVWRDLEKLATGDDWQAAALDTISKVDAVVLLLTPGAVASKQVEWEWSNALRRRKRVIPYLIRPCTLPETFPPNILYKDLTQAGYAEAPLELIGHLSREWLQIDEELAVLREYLLDRMDDKEAQSLFAPVIDKLESKLRLIKPPALPPEVFRACFRVLRELIDAYPDISTQVANLVAGTYAIPEPLDILAYHLKAIQALFGDFRKRLPGIQVRFVVVAMNADEARALADGSALRDYPELQPDLDRLRRELGTAGLNDWPKRYQENERGWQPFGSNNGTIGDLLQAILQFVTRDGACPKPLLPQFIDVRTLNRNLDQLKDLRSNGCVVIADAISTRYPPLQRQLRDSKLDAYSTTLFAHLAPSESIFHLPTNDNFAMDTWFQSEFDRRKQDDDPQCERIWTWDQLRRFLRREIPRALQVCQAKAPGIWRQMHRFD